jgi:hypothetical protein
MTAKRTPIYRPVRGRLSPEALDLYAELRGLRCTCAHCNLQAEGRCPGCRRWRKLYPTFQSMMRAGAPWIRPWQIPNFGLDRNGIVTGIGATETSNSEEMFADLEVALEMRVLK